MLVVHPTTKCEALVPNSCSNYRERLHLEWQFTLRASQRQ